MSALKNLVQQYQQISSEISQFDFSVALERTLRMKWSDGRVLSFNFDPHSSVDDYIAEAWSQLAFSISAVQDETDGLVVAYGHADDEENKCLGLVVVPWKYFIDEAQETVESQHASQTSYIDSKLVEYVTNRGIEMPFYTNGGKITEEAKELQEALIAYLQNKTPANLAHLKEEVADVTIVAAVAARQNGFTVEEALEVKIAKDKNRGEKKAS